MITYLNSCNLAKFYKYAHKLRRCIMSALIKKHHIDRIAEISWHGRRYAVPIEIMENYKIKSDNNENISLKGSFAF